MRQHKPHDVSDQKSPTRGRYNSLFYFQQEGQRSHLRFTPLGAIVLVLIIVIPVIALLIMFFINSQSPEQQINTNVTVKPAAPYSSNTPIIRQAPAPSPAKVVKQPSMPSPSTVATPDNKQNNQVPSKQTTQPLPSESPP